jgi:hypothetical protein
VASIERTAYPRFKRVISARELEESFAPTQEEIAWAQGMTRSAPHLLALVLTLKTFQRLGYFAAPEEIPTVVVEHVRRSLRLADDVAAAPESPRTLRHHRSLVRERIGVVTDAEYARKLAESAIEAAAQTKDVRPTSSTWRSRRSSGRAARSRATPRSTRWPPGSGPA